MTVVRNDAVPRRLSSQTRERVGAALMAVSFVLTGLLGLRILQHWSGVPFWDEWEWAHLSYLARTSGLTIGDLWQVHNEHRNFIPNVAFVLIDRIAGWDILLELFAGLGAIIVAQVFLLLLVRKTIASPVLRGAAFLVASLLITSPAQYENFTMGFNLGWEICTMGLVIAVYGLSAAPTWGNLALAIAGALVASLSSGQGLLLWFCGLVPLIGFPWSLAKRVAWLLAAAATFVTYFSSYVPNAAGHVSVLGNLGAMAVYALMFLGVPFEYRYVVWTGITSSVVALALIAAILFVAIRATSAEIVRACLPWLAFIIYALVASVTVAQSRAGLGLLQAESSRYVAIAMFLFIGLAGAICALADRRKLPQPKIVLVLAAMYLTLGVVAGNDGVTMWTLWVDDRALVGEQLRAGDDRHTSRIYPDRSRLKTLIKEVCAVSDSPVGCAVGTST